MTSFHITNYCIFILEDTEIEKEGQIRLVDGRDEAEVGFAYFTFIILRKYLLYLAYIYHNYNLDEFVFRETFKYFTMVNGELFVMTNGTYTKPK